MSVNSKQLNNQAYVKSATGGISVTSTAADMSRDPQFVVNEDVFKYDPLYSPLKSTQQLNIDWWKFEEHTFFSSAEVKVNESFNVMINNYPFDGSKEEYEKFFAGLTGFERHVYDQFPTWKGALHFSGTTTGENPANGYQPNLGTWVAVKDKAGNLYPDISKNSTGETIINPGESDSLSVEVQIYLPQIQNSTQVIFQKCYSEDYGFTLHLEPTTSVDKVTAVFSVCSGSKRNNVSGSLKKGSYNHVCVVLDKEDYSENKLKFFVNESLSSESERTVSFGDLNTENNDLLMGSGSSFYSLSHLVTPLQTFSGVMDEFRLFHSVRSEKQQKLFASKGIYATSDLRLYYRFNEPALLTLNELDPANRILLDASGNSLHAAINNFTSSLRIDAALDPKSPMTNEKDEFTKILFPAYAQVRKLNEDYLSLAKSYDLSNPNLITKLIPRHYLLEGAYDEGFESVENSTGADGKYTGNGIPGQGKKESVQIILSFLYIWAKFFDELKQYLDAFVTMRTVDYDEHIIDTMPDNFLIDLVKQTGFYIPQFFVNARPEQYADGENVIGNDSISTTLKKINSHITRRILMNISDVMRSKGTQHSIKSFLRTIGLDPDNTLKIREYGGPTTKQLTTSRVKKSEFNAMLDFTSNTLLTSSYMSGSRIEPGYPEIDGNFLIDELGNNSGTDHPNDGLFTSGSWTIEGTYKIPPQKIKPDHDYQFEQSLMRLCVTGSNAYEKTGIVANVIAKSKTFTKNPEVTAYFRPGYSATAPLLKLSMTMPGEGIFDGDPWYVSIGSFRSDDALLSNNQSLSSSYFLRVGKSEWGEVVSLHQTSSYFLEDEIVASTLPHVLRSLSNDHNRQGAFIAIGSDQNVYDDPTYNFLNNTIEAPEESRITDYQGWASNLRFWSKGLTEEEFKEHIRNYKSTGVSNPLKNYNFVTKMSGSFEKLRMNVILRQSNKLADASGNYFLDDDSLNGNVASVSGYSSGATAMVGSLFSYGHLSPSFDEMSQDDKVRVRSYSDLNSAEAKDSPWAVQAPSYLYRNLFVSEEPMDDTRLSIEFSLVDSLNKDIVNMFATFDSLNNAIGDPELAFSPDYPALEDLRDVYFNRLSDKLNFRSFFEFYRWFDNTVSTFIDQLIPAKTRYKGTNFVIESHMLERHKKQYYHNEMYMGEKQVINDSLLIQLLSMVIKKY